MKMNSTEIEDRSSKTGQAYQLCWEVIDNKRESWHDENLWDGLGRGKKIVDRDEYYKDLDKKRQEHIQKQQEYKKKNEEPFQPCLHECCPDCFGTGRKVDGSSCIHMISCPCPKCTLRM